MSEACNTDPVILTSRSAIGTFRRCNREYGYRYAGLLFPEGAQAPLPDRDLLLGIALHAGQEQVMKARTVKLALAEALDTWTNSNAGGFGGHKPEHWSYIRNEGAAMLVAWMLGWERTRREQFFSEFKVVSVEEGHSVELAPGFLFRWKDDVVVRDFFGHLYDVDFKTHARVEMWNQRWTWEPQSFTQPMMTEALMGETVHGTVYEGFLKGAQASGLRPEDPKIMNTPLIYGARNEDRTQYSADFAWARKKGWEKFAVWEAEEFGGDIYSRVQYWINWLPAELVRDQFITGEPVKVNREVGREYFENAVKDLRRAHAENYFPRSESKWNCERCEFRQVCWGLEGAPAFVPREDHYKRAPAAPGGEKA